MRGGVLRAHGGHRRGARWDWGIRHWHWRRPRQRVEKAAAKGAATCIPSFAVVGGRHYRGWRKGPEPLPSVLTDVRMGDLANTRPAGPVENRVRTRPKAPHWNVPAVLGRYGTSCLAAKRARVCGGVGSRVWPCGSQVPQKNAPSPCGLYRPQSRPPDPSALSVTRDPKPPPRQSAWRQGWAGRAGALWTHGRT